MSHNSQAPASPQLLRDYFQTKSVSVPPRSKIIGVDVDLVVFDTLTPWLDWFEAMYGFDFKHIPGEYDLVPAMLEQCAQNGARTDILKPFDFWEKPDLYDLLQPIPGCWNKISAWNAAGHSIVFVSKCVPAHENSKRLRLKQYFPFAKGFIATGDKQYARYDVLIDDNLENIETCRAANPDAEHLMLTQISSKVFDGVDGYNKHELAVKHWDDLPDFFV